MLGGSLWNTADGYDAIIARLGASEILLPAQIGGRWRELVNEDAAHRLRFAVLLRALSDYQLKRLERNEVRAWLATEGYPFSFGEICEAFGWEESWMRARIRRWMAVVDGGGRLGWKIHRSPGGSARRMGPKPRRVRR
jgi:hypothetical protein